MDQISFFTKVHWYPIGTRRLPLKVHLRTEALACRSYYRTHMALVYEDQGGLVDRTHSVSGYPFLIDLSRCHFRNDTSLINLF